VIDPKTVKNILKNTDFRISGSSLSFTVKSKNFSGSFEHFGKYDVPLPVQVPIPENFLLTVPLEALLKGRLGTLDLLVLTSSDELFLFIIKHAILMRRSTVRSLPLQLVFLVVADCI